MRAMVLKEQGKPLLLENLPKPVPNEDELLIKVSACAVCRTDLHIIDKELQEPKLPLILGHQVVGYVEDFGKNVQGFKKNERVGMAWLGWACGRCEYCKEGLENLCDKAKFTGYNLDGGFAEYAISHHAFAYRLPEGLSDVDIAPLLCGGLIGYRAYRKAAPKQNIGFYGFGSSAHILAQLALYEDKEIYAFTREGDEKGQQFAKKMGAVWAGSSKEMPPKKLDCAIVFASVGELIPLSLKALKKGGRCISAAIHMTDIPSFPYKDLWGERKIESVANLTREDGKGFLEIAPKVPIKTMITTYPLEKLNEAIKDLKDGKIKGSAVIDMRIKT